jgi:hypothetical protein
MFTFRKTSTALLAGILGFSGGLPAADFLRGDVDGSGRISVSDAIRILVHLFQGDPAAVPCADAADADDSGAIDLADAVHLLSGLFLGGPAPAAPFPACGVDPTEDALGCEEACPPMIVYLERELRADGLFVIIDRSERMLVSGDLARIKTETERLIQDLPLGVEFGVIFFAANVIAFPGNRTPAESTDAMKASAVAFIRNTPPGSAGSCGLAALLEAMEFAKGARGRNPAILYVSDGGGTCSGEDEAAYAHRLLETVTAENAGLARIHTFSCFGFGNFLEQLARRNGGTAAMCP